VDFGGHRGYIVEKIGEGERILPYAVAQKFEMSSTGALVPPTEGSTKPVTVIVTKRRDRTVITAAASK
jgi:hypothetical protein